MKLTGAEKREYEAWLELRKRISLATVTTKKESPKEKQKRIKRLLHPDNFEEFVKYYFPHYYGAPFGWFHKEGAKEILSNDNTFNIWEWAREHAKSVMANVFIPMRLYASGDLTGFILASENELKAKVLIKDIEAEFRSNEKFKSDFGETNILGSWLSGNFYTSDGIGFWSFGLGQNPAGVRNAEKRPNVGVVDDADSKKKYQKNQGRCKEDMDWILGEFLGCLSIKAKHFIFANNRVAKNGLTAHMVGDVNEGDPKRKGVKHIKVYATENPRTHEKLMPSDPGAKPSWKENYSLNHILRRMEEFGYRNAMRQFFHHHIEDGNIFLPEHITWIQPLPLHKYDSLITYCDPSFKDTKKNDFKAIVLIGKTGKYFDILWAWVRQSSVSNMVKSHYDIGENIEADFNPLIHQVEGAVFRQVVCPHYMEANFIQDLLLDEYDKEGEDRGYQLRIRPDKRQKPDKYARIEDLEPLFARKLVRWNENMKKDQDFQTLKDQFLAFPNDHDDGPDAVEGAIFLLNKRSSGKKRNPGRSGNYNKNKNRVA